jgi:hypothetical protein
MCMDAALNVSVRNLASLATYGTTKHSCEPKLAHVTQCRPCSGRDYGHHGGEIRYI